MVSPLPYERLSGDFVPDIHGCLHPRHPESSGLRIESGPDIIRNDTVEGNEVNNLTLAVD